MIVKTDRKDARGIAQLLRMGWFRPVHRKSPDAQEVRVLLVGRKLLQAKLRDVELSIRGLLRGFGLKVGEVSKGRFAARIKELVAGHAMLETVIAAMLQARDGPQIEFMRCLGGGRPRRPEGRGGCGPPPGSRSWWPATPCWRRSSPPCCRRATACRSSSCAASADAGH